MKSTTFAAMLVLATGAIARNCTPDLNYCGRTLLEIGNYQPQIDQALHDAGAGEANGGSDDLFHCGGGPNGVITFIGFCANGCRTNPTNVNDACN
ncbi:hypothetical protein C8F04DRAFT_1070212 [Mycena alexandri]|uniref:Uncharacterized protein n=1 Tax=Mycena alexandri TaxID=1745969 RepID=A0AAD6TFS5_9AGAR|nr:hypothetical protein C8F04DRAFT_1070212 [Mycena alexandri]